MSTPCPDCGAPLASPHRCDACGLSLVGPLAQRLWWVDQQLASLTEERTSLLARLRAQPPQHQPAVLPVPSAIATAMATGQREATPHSAQNTLLGLGAVLLAAAVLVFAAVTYSHLGAGGRAAVLVLLTAVAGAAATALTRRSLAASAEAVGAVTLVLGVADAWALRRTGLGTGVDGLTWSAVASGALALLTGAWAVTVPLRVTQAATVVFGQGLVVLELGAHAGSAARTGLVLGLLVAADVVAWRLPLPRATAWTAAGFGAVWTAGVVVASARAFAGSEPEGCVGLLVLAAVAAWLAWDGAGPAAAAVPGLAAAALFVASRPALTDAQRPLVLAAVSLLSLSACALLARRAEAVAGALAVAAAALLVEGRAVVEAVGGPFTWLADPWSSRGGAARDAVAVGMRWDGTVVTVVVVAAAAVGLLVAGLLLDRLREAAVPAGLLLAVAALTLPLGLATSYGVALGLQLGLGVLLCAVGLRRPEAVPGGLGVLAVATAWSLAQQDATLVAVAASAGVVAVLSARLPHLTGVALALAGGELAAVGAAQGLHRDQVGALLLLALPAAVGLGFVVDGARRWGSEGAACLLGVAALALTVRDPGWLSWSLAGCGLAALCVAVRPDRRAVGYAGALLLSASSWVRLADARVHAPEPYVLPLAAMTLVLGVLRRRSHPATSSFEAYGSGLTLALVPSVVASADDPTPFRALLVLLAAAAVVLVGAQQRLRAPLVVGGLAALAETVVLLAPYAAALPRWLVLAVVGALLVGVGATYEQRRRDVHRLRERFDSLA